MKQVVCGCVSNLASRWSLRSIPGHYHQIPLTLTLIFGNKSSKLFEKASIKVMNSFSSHKTPAQCNGSMISIDQHVVRWLFNGIFTVKTFILHNGKAILSPLFPPPSFHWSSESLCAQAEEEMRTFANEHESSFAVNERSAKKEEKFQLSQERRPFLRTF